MESTQKLREAAAITTIERIRRDHERAPAQVRPLLAHLETHLFDHDLDAQQLKIACGVRDNTLSLRFHQALGLPPYAYIEDCRMQVACRLLRDTDLKIWQITQLLGYSVLQVFSRAFHRWSGRRPSVYRRQALAKAGTSRPRCSSLPSAEPPLSSAILRKAANGCLERSEADQLVRHLARLYPESFGSVSEVGA